MVKIGHNQVNRKTAEGINIIIHKKFLHMTFANHENKTHTKEESRRLSDVEDAANRITKLVEKNRDDFKNHVIILLNVLSEARKQVMAGSGKEEAMRKAVAVGKFVVIAGKERVEAVDKKARASIELLIEDEGFAIEVANEFIHVRDTNVTKPMQFRTTQSGKNYVEEYNAALDKILEIYADASLKEISRVS